LAAVARRSHTGLTCTILTACREIPALDEALRLLALRLRTALELDRAWKGPDSPNRAKIDAARVRELGYINDPETARVRARTRVEQGDAPSLVARKLLAQGIAEPDARAASIEAAEGAKDEGAGGAGAETSPARPQAADEREETAACSGACREGPSAPARRRRWRMAWEGNDEIDDC